jgi:hypothetical protein
VSYSKYLSDLMLEEIIQRCDHYPEVRGKGFWFEWSMKDGGYMWPGISEREVEKFRAFIEACVSFIHEGMAAEEKHGLEVLPNKAHFRLVEKGGSVFEEKFEPGDLLFEPHVLLSAYVDAAEFTMNMCDSLFFVDRLEEVRYRVPSHGNAKSVTLQSHGFHIRWQLGNLWLNRLNSPP